MKKLELDLEGIKDYQQNDNRIKYFKHDVNKGNAAARNTALKYSTGFYVSFLDDDDEWIDSEKLEHEETMKHLCRLYGRYSNRNGRKLI